VELRLGRFLLSSADVDNMLLRLVDLGSDLTVRQASTLFSSGESFALGIFDHDDKKGVDEGESSVLSETAEGLGRRRKR
jgi:hypothetical protein